ncbi:hypothetical protein ACLOJK_029170 [Asimina triloba]
MEHQYGAPSSPIQPICISFEKANLHPSGSGHDPASQRSYTPASDVHEATPHQAGSPHLPHFRPPSTADLVMAAPSCPRLPPAEKPSASSITPAVTTHASPPSIAPTIST